MSESVYKKLKLYGIEGLVHLPAYVPPITKSIRNKIKRKYTVFFNIWKVDSRKSVTVYGIDLLIEIASLYPDIQFECFVSSEKNLRLLYDSINQRKVKNIEVVVGENLVSHFSRADLFLRLNRDDAYGVSIQEALDCGVPAIASDVCLRPRGALLFESGNLKQLKAVFERALSLPRHTLISERLSTKYHLELIDIYRRNLGR
ncbi:glycosyltransferase [Hahella ganghwensis]|uniref:glycosyltransferase n=1 Tax=Hahella ganghwensis TaxID=286420 RepID=UPI0012F7D698|nr:glycosyltransferase [Hahella ganghwensis]